MKMKATKLAAILSRLLSAWRLPQATLAMALAIAALASPAHAAEGEYTLLDGGLYKAAPESKILVTDYWLNEKTWMEVELKFAKNDAGFDNADPSLPLPDWQHTCILGHCDLDYSVGHGGIVRNPKEQYQLPMYFAWADGNVNRAISTYDTLPAPTFGDKITLRLENGQVSILYASGSVQSSNRYCTRTNGKADGPLALFGYSFSIAPFPYHSHDMTVYSLKIYESANGKTGDVSTLVRDYRPAEKDGQQGLYDVVGGNFFKLSDVSSSSMRIDFNGGTCAALSTFGMESVALVPVIPGEALPEFPAGALPTKSGNVLAGFYDANEENLYYTGDGKTQQICGTTPPILHAVWVKWTYKINYDLKGGDYPAENPVESATADQAVKVIAPVRNGYRFTGWKVTGYESGAKYALSEGGTENDVGSATVPCAADGSVWFKNLRSQSESGEETVTLTAQWENISWTGGDYDPANWTPNPRNILQGNVATVEGMGLGNFSTTGGAACLTDGVIPGSADPTKIAALKGGTPSADTTLTWSFDGVASVESLTIFTYASGQWGHSVISVKKLEVQHCGSDKWETVKGDAWTYFGKENDATKMGTLSSLSGGKLFENAAKMRLTLTAPVAYNGSDAFYSTMAEIEAVGTVEPLRQWVRFTITKKGNESDELCELRQFGVFDKYNNCLNLDLTRNITICPPTGSSTIYNMTDAEPYRYKTSAEALAPGEFAYYAGRFNMSGTEKSVNLFKDDTSKWESTNIGNLRSGTKQCHQEFTMRLPDNVAPMASYDLRLNDGSLAARRAPISWTVETSSDGINWHLFDERNDFTPPTTTGAWYFGDDHNNNISWFTKLANFAGPEITDPNATGGDFIYKVGNDYVHVFTNKTAAQTFHVNSACQAKVLVIAGGGNGGVGAAQNCNGSGGGGAGGYIEEPCSFTAGMDYTITVGGAGQNTSISILNYTAHAGGRGGSLSSGQPATAGGSGGGGYSHVTGGEKGGGSTAVSPERGNKGADGTTNGLKAGGGGGAGSAGSVSDGGLGAFSSITGFDSWYCGGGGGGVATAAAPRGMGQSGGGNGAYIDGSAATSASTPGSGGGGGFQWNGGGSGMQGIVVIRVMGLGSISLNKDKATYNDSGWGTLPTYTVVDNAGNTLTQGTDYTTDGWKNASGTVVTSAAKVGTYTIMVTGAGGRSGTLTATYVVSPKVLQVPADCTSQYTGIIQDCTPPGVEKTFLTMNNGQYTQPGTYDVKFSLGAGTTHLAANLIWSDGTTTQKTIRWTIESGTLIDRPTQGTSTFPADGTDHKPTISGDGFTVTYSPDSAWTEIGNSYKATIKLQSGYQWNTGNANEDIVFTYVIVKLLPPNYDYIDKLHFNGSTFVRTRYVPNTKTWIKADMQAIGTYGSGGLYLFGQIYGEKSYGEYFNNSLQATGYLAAKYNTLGKGYVTYDTAQTTRSIAKLTHGGVGWGSSWAGGAQFSNTVTYEGAIPIVIGGRNNILPGADSDKKPGYGVPVEPFSVYSGGLDVYSFQVYESDNGGEGGANQSVKLDLVPVKRTTDNVEGLFDLNTNDFYPLLTQTIVTLNPNGGDALSTNYVYATAGEAMPTVTEIPTKSGYVFQGYFTAASGGDKYYNADGMSAKKCDLTNGTTLYAQWKESTIYVDKPQQGTPTSWVYDATNHKPVFAENVCYTITYSTADGTPTDSWVNAGCYKVTFTLNPNCAWNGGDTDPVVFDYSITKPISDVTITDLKWWWDNYPHQPTVTDGGRTLVYDVDFTAVVTNEAFQTPCDYTNIVGSATTYDCTLTGKGCYTGTTNFTFTLARPTLKWTDTCGTNLDGVGKWNEDWKKPEGEGYSNSGDAYDWSYGHYPRSSMQKAELSAASGKSLELDLDGKEYWAYHLYDASAGKVVMKNGILKLSATSAISGSGEHVYQNMTFTSAITALACLYPSGPSTVVTLSGCAFPKDPKDTMVFTIGFLSYSAGIDGTFRIADGLTALGTGVYFGTSYSGSNRCGLTVTNGWLVASNEGSDIAPSVGLQQLALNLALGDRNTVSDANALIDLNGTMRLNKGSTLTVDAGRKDCGTYKLIRVTGVGTGADCLTFADLIANPTVTNVLEGKGAQLVVVTDGDKETGIDLVIRTKVAKPTVTTSFIYDETEKTAGGVATGYTVTGDKATNVGRYEFVATLADGYCWSDGAIAPYHVDWSIKAQVTFDANGGSGVSPATLDVLPGDDLGCVAVPTMDGHVFAGYFTAQTGGVRYYDADGKGVKASDFTENATLYAHWANNSLTGAKVILTPSAATTATYTAYETVKVTVVIDGEVVAEKKSFAQLSEMGINAAWGQTPTATVGTYPLNLTPKSGGSTTFTGSTSANFRVNPDAPSAVDGAALWFDAADAAKLTLSKEAMTADEIALGAGVTFVSDWAKNLGGVDHMSALTKTGDNKRKGNRPYLGTMDNGNHYVDFGSVYNLSKAEPMKSGYGAGFGWFDENGAVTNKTGIMDVYMVVMDDAGCNARYSGSCQYQHFLGSSSDAEGSSSFYRLKDYGYIFIDKYIGASTADAFIDGIISVDGKEVDCRTLYPSGFHVLRFASSGKAGDASALCSNKLDAQGGLKYGELIVFDEVQSDANATAIIDYLYRKWLGDAPKNDILIQFDNGEDASEKLTNGFLMARHAVRTQDIPIKYIDSSVVGYTFQGYFETPTGGTQYYNYDGTPCDDTNATCPFEADTTVYAVWTGNVYTVTLDADGGSGGTSEVRASYGSPMPAATMPTKAGFEFDGYYYDGWYVTQMLGLKADVVKDGTLKYAYAPEATTVNGVAFTATLAGGVTTMGNLGVDVAFDGTDDSCKGEGEDHAYQLLMTNRIYVASGESALTRTLALGGLTAGKSYLVQVIAHKNQGTVPKLSVDSSAEYSLTQFGWSFVRRFVAASSTQEVVLRAPAGSDLMFNAIQVRELGDARYYDETGASAQSWNMAKDTTLKAHWMERYEITYDGLEGATHENPAQYTAKSEIVLRAPTKRDGYVFGGWTTNNVPLGRIAKGTTGALTLTATWVATNDFMAVEYIATTNCQYLDTGVTPRNAHFGFALDFWDQCYLDKTRQTGEYYNDRAIIGSTGLNGVGFAICNYNSGGTLQGEFTFFNVVTWGQWWWDYTRDFDPLLRGDVRLRMTMLNDLTGEAYATGGKTRKDDEAYSKYTLEQVNGDSTFTPITTAFHKLKTGDGQDPYQDMPEWFLGPIAVGGAYMIEGNVTNFTRYARGVGGGDANNHFMRFYRVTFYHDDIVIYDAIPVIQKSTGHRGLLRVDGTVGNVFAYSGTQYDGVTNAYEQVRTGGFGATKEEMAAMPLGINEFKTPLLDLSAILDEADLTVRVADPTVVKDAVDAAMRACLDGHDVTRGANFVVLYAQNDSATLDESAVINASLHEDVATLAGWSAHPPSLSGSGMAVRAAILTAVTKPYICELKLRGKPMYHVIRPDGPEIEVDEEWLVDTFGERTEEQYQAALFTTNANGVVAWQAYVLGFTGAEVKAGTAKIVEETVQNASPDTVTIRLKDLPEESVRPETGCTVKYSLYAARTTAELLTNGGTVVKDLDGNPFERCEKSTFEAPLSDLSDENPVNYYRIKVHFIFDGGGSGGGGDAVELYSLESGQTVRVGEYPDDNWSLSASGGSVSLNSLTIPVEQSDAGYLLVTYTVKSQQDASYVYVNFCQAGTHDLINRGPGYITQDCDGFNDTNGGTDTHTCVYRIPPTDAFGSLDVRWQKSDGLVISDVKVESVDYLEAAKTSDEIFAATVDSEALATAKANYLDAGNAQWTRNLKNLRKALNGEAPYDARPYNMLILGDSLSGDMVYGCVEALIKRQFPDSNLRMYVVKEDNTGCVQFMTEDTDGNKALKQLDFANYDGVVYAGTSQARNTYVNKDTETCNAVERLTDYIRDSSRNPTCEIIMLSPMLSVDSRMFKTYGEWNPTSDSAPQHHYWDTAQVYVGQVGSACAKVENWDVAKDSWAAVDYAAMPSIGTTCANKDMAYWDLYKVAYDYLFRSGKTYAFYSRDAQHANAVGQTLTAHLVFEAFKIVGGASE